MIQYCSASLYLASISGNKYVNGICFGAAEVFTMVLTNYLMNNFHDLTAFRVIYGLGACAYFLLIFFSESVWVPYAGIMLLNMSIGGWFNTQLLVLELRVPPQNVGSVAAIIRTISVGAAISAPTISNLPAPWPLVTLAALAFFAMVLTFLLPPPGQFLPKTHKGDDFSVDLVDKQESIAVAREPFNASLKGLTNFALHHSSFFETYSERVLNVTRP